MFSEDALQEVSKLQIALPCQALRYDRSYGEDQLASADRCAIDSFERDDSPLIVSHFADTAPHLRAFSHSIAAKFGRADLALVCNLGSTNYFGVPSVRVRSPEQLMQALGADLAANDSTIPKR